MTGAAGLKYSGLPDRTIYRFSRDSPLEGNGFELLLLTISGQLSNDTADLLVDTWDKTRDKTLHLSGGFRWQDQR
jgi:hypothetical protein